MVSLTFPLLNPIELNRWQGIGYALESPHGLRRNSGMDEVRQCGSVDNRNGGTCSVEVMGVADSLIH